MARFTNRFPHMRNRRAVGAIIGGVILAAILLTTVMVYFITILNNEKAKTSYEILSSQMSEEKADESFLVTRLHGIDEATDKISVRISNNGSLAFVASKILVYCVSAGCPDPDPIDTGAIPPLPITANVTTPLTLNAGEVVPAAIGPFSDTLTYRVEVVSERGNIVASKECTVNLTTHVCENDSTGGEGEEPPCLTCAFNEGIVQGTGSLQLDFRAFGTILPQFADRDGVDQRGWKVTTASKYGSATGYPGFEIPYHAHVFFVERMRNLDPSGEDIVLTRKTALITNQGTVPSGQQSVVYICNANSAATDGVEAYNEQAASKLIHNTPLDADITEGWEEVFFCSENPGIDYISGNGSCGSSASSTGYCPEHTNSQLNGIIMVARGTFSSSLSQYGQTIPYQSAQPGLSDYTSFYWCLYETNTNVACAAPGTPSAASNLIYTAQRGNSGVVGTMRGGLTIYAHYAGTSGALPNPGATITWIYPDGNSVVLKNNVDLVNQNIPITLPTQNHDGTPIDCAPGQNDAYYVLKINDSFSSEGTRNVYYMTFRMTCT